MARFRVARLLSASVFAFGVCAVMVPAGLEAASKQEEAQKARETLKNSKDPKKRAEAIEELGKLGQIQKALAEPATDDIKKALEDKDATVRKAAAEAYGKIDPDPKEAVPALRKLLKDDKDDAVKLAAVHGLAAMRENAKEAKDDLQAIVKAEKANDKKSKLGKAAGDALKAIGGGKKK